MLRNATYLIRIQPIRNSLRLICGHSVTFPCPPATVRDGKLIQMKYSCHHVDTIRHPNSSYVTTKMYGTSIRGCNNNRIFSGRTISFRLCVDATIIGSFQKEQFPSAGVCRALQRRSLDDSCQSGKMAALLNSLFFMFTISFLPKYCVKYNDYIVKWCNGV